MKPSALQDPAEDPQFWLRLVLTPGVGNATARRLLAALGPPENIFCQSRAALQQLVTPAQASALLTGPQGFDQALANTRQWLLHAPAAGGDAMDTDKTAAARPAAPSGVARALLVLGDPRYPRLLLETEDPPLVLFVLGAARFLQPGGTPFPDSTCLAMVGSRNPSAQGAQNARQFSQALRSAGLTIVSGLALGIDAAAHEGALHDSTDVPHSDSDNESATPATIAVVGTGLDRVYPRRHLALAHRIAAHGLLVSEYPLGTPPLPANFPKRNRIIAGLSQGTLVVEAAPASGSLITARLANEQGREVFAIPGSIHAPQSRGCHALIRQGAKLVESVQDVLEELQLPAALSVPAFGPALQRAAPATSPKRRPVVVATGAAMPEPPARHVPAAPASAAATTAEENDPLLQALGYDAAGLDALQARTGLDTATLQVQLLERELAGQVARLPGGLFQRIGSA